MLLPLPTLTVALLKLTAVLEPLAVASALSIPPRLIALPLTEMALLVRPRLPLPLVRLAAIVRAPLDASRSRLLPQVTSLLTASVPDVVESRTLPTPSRFCSEVVLMFVVAVVPVSSVSAAVETVRLPAGRSGCRAQDRRCPP